MKKILLFSALTISLALSSQSYNGPESVEFDYANNRWLIGNKNNGTVIARDMNGNFTTFATGMTGGPYGIEILGNTLYCCNNGGNIKGYDLTSGTQVFNLNTGATFLNGICSDGVNNLYVTDFSAKKIYRVNVANSTFNVFVPSIAKSPNGIIYDGTNQRLIFVTWGTSAVIQQVDLSDSLVSTIVTTTYSNIDGIAADAYGNHYISTWGGNSIRKYSSNFTSGPTTVYTGLSSPADIFYNTVTDTLAVPNSGTANNVVWIGFGTTGIEQRENNSGINIFPQPSVCGEFTVQAKENIEAIKIYDVSGKVVFEKGDFTPAKNIELKTRLEPGIYFATIYSGRKSEQIKVVVQ